MSVQKSKRRKLTGWITNLLFFGLLLVVVFSPDAKAWVLKQLVNVGLFRPHIDKDAGEASMQPPVDFHFRDENGKIMATGELKGKVVFINFWASWCPPCRAEMPSLAKLYNELKDDDRFVFLFMNEDEDAVNGKRFLESNNYPFPFVSAAGAIPQEVYSGTLPTTVILNKEGRMVMHHEGLAGYSGDDFIKQLKNLVNDTNDK